MDMAPTANRAPRSTPPHSIGPTASSGLRTAPVDTGRTASATGLPRIVIARPTSTASAPMIVNGRGETRSTSSAPGSGDSTTLIGTAPSRTLGTCATSIACEQPRWPGVRKTRNAIGRYAARWRRGDAPASAARTARSCSLTGTACGVATVGDAACVATSYRFATCTSITSSHSARADATSLPTFRRPTRSATSERTAWRGRNGRSKRQVAP